MTRKLTLDIPLNRVEGDLEIRAEVDGERVSDAWACGTLYRGFEKILVGRAALDALVIAPRICGICTSAHLVAAARALDGIAGATPPAAAVRMRNVADHPAAARPGPHGVLPRRASAAFAPAPISLRQLAPWTASPAPLRPPRQSGCATWRS